MKKTLNSPLPFTADPFRLAIADLALWLRITFIWPPSKGLPSIIWPWYPFRSGPLDELYPSPQNLWAIILHIILITFQLGFLLIILPSSLFGLPIPVLLSIVPISIISVAGTIVVNNMFCVLLNGTRMQFKSVCNPSWQAHADEKWIFVNGVAVGNHWMQSNLDRLAMTFRRPIMGIHNKTRGIIFDVIEVVIQRTFGYATRDVRDLYAHLLELVEEKKEDKARWKKIVLILHSQGAVEGSLALDWLYATAGQEVLQRIEVYTFGNAANHFNSPEIRDGRRLIKHIEHYANLDDYVARFGILNFRPLPWISGYQSVELRKQLRDRYVGRLFVRKGSGHQLNGNYLNNWFQMSIGSDGKLLKVREANEDMDAKLDTGLLRDYNLVWRESEQDIWARSEVSTDQTNEIQRIKDVSRLWEYRNGLSPAKD